MEEASRALYPGVRPARNPAEGAFDDSGHTADEHEVNAMAVQCRDDRREVSRSARRGAVR